MRVGRAGGLVVALLGLVSASCLVAQGGPAALRAPATPLVAFDPYFSIWSMADHLTDGPTKHWTGTYQGINGLIRVDGKTYRFLGNADRLVPALEEVGHEITPTRTIVTLSNGAVEVRLTFLSSAFPEDLRLLARPVTYLEWTVRSRDGAEHEVSLYLDFDGAIATNDTNELVDWSRAEANGLHLLRVGTGTQPVLEKSGDLLRIDWGYFYVGVPDGERSELVAGNQMYRRELIASGHLPHEDDLDGPRAPQGRYAPAPALNVMLPLGKVGEKAVARHVLLAYDERYPIEYMHQKMLPYWRKEFKSFGSLLTAAERDYPEIEKRAAAYDAGLAHDLVATGGPEYAAIAILAFRQALAAHGLAMDANEVPFYMPKENYSNGSVSTVDVIYPSAPMFLLLNPKLVEAMLEPVLRYAATSQWKFPFAPHDLGVYPLANGQTYGGGEASEENQMPVEESGNILILADTLAHAERKADFAAKYWPLLTKWAEYLEAKGFDPENQLCTDDFAGHLAHNTNLSIKAIEALAAYAQLAEMLGHHDVAVQYAADAKGMAAKWVAGAADGDHYKLAFDQSGTWSLKYNLVWDRILGFDLFPEAVADAEVSLYKSHLNTYGVPLDNRATYTKLDWELWVATLAQQPEDFQALVHPVFRFLNETPDRVPMTDWYDTITGRQRGFQARSVVGGVYIKMLAAPEMWRRWVAKVE